MPNNEVSAPTKLALFDVSFSPPLTMIGNPRAQIDGGHFLMFNPCRPIPSRKGLRLLDVAWFQRIISAKRSGLGSNWRTRKAGKI
jgi:hypothetical protein